MVIKERLMFTDISISVTDQLDIRNSANECAQIVIDSGIGFSSRCRVIPAEYIDYIEEYVGRKLSEYEWAYANFCFECYIQENI
jgi:hypothetical protein